MDVEKNEMTQVLKTLSSIETKLDRALDDVEDHEERLRKLECRSGDRWNGLVDKLIVFTVSAVGGYLLAQLLNKGG